MLVPGVNYKRLRYFLQLPDMIPPKFGLSQELTVSEMCKLCYNRKRNSNVEVKSLEIHHDTYLVFPISQRT